jgi:hypothetical protein
MDGTMNLHIERSFVNELVQAFPRLVDLQDQLRFGNKAEVSFTSMTPPERSYLLSLYESAGPEMQGRAAQVATLYKALNDDNTLFRSDDLEAILPHIASYLIDSAIRGWLFRSHVSGKPIAYVITRLDYTPPGEEESGRILLELKANSMGKLVTETLIIRSRDIEGKSISAILSEKGFLRESPELIQSYDDSAARYFEWRSQYGVQFSGKGVGIYAEDPTASHRDRDWARKNVVVLSSSDEAARLVNDESILSERVLSFEASGDILGKYLRKAGNSARYDCKVEDQMTESRSRIDDSLFTELPVHGYILMFHMDLHHHVWVHVDDIRPYQYNPELKDKLILPQEQVDLIDILTAEMDVLMDDIVEGKSGGTTVLCSGPAGVGKTLTAEVYSEIIQRPLYRVHSGQLGLNVAEMEKALKDTLTRAQRWGAVMLIDEADVYIKRRDDNIAANAVVGVFLRVLEYFNGLLFMTTNRVDDIDEAIISRCIAMIRYHQPGPEDRRQIWEVMSDQFSLDISMTLIDELVGLFPNATGRDIKGLVKLVSKFCRHKQVNADIDVFRQCSIFRGIDIVN